MGPDRLPAEFISIGVCPDDAAYAPPISPMPCERAGCESPSTDINSRERHKPLRLIKCSSGSNVNRGASSSASNIIPTNDLVISPFEAPITSGEKIFLLLLKYLPAS
jgi:hypothetical protein